MADDSKVYGDPSPSAKEDPQDDNQESPGTDRDSIYYFRKHFDEGIMDYAVFVRSNDDIPERLRLRMVVRINHRVFNQSTLVMTPAEFKGEIDLELKYQITAMFVKILDTKAEDDLFLSTARAPYLTTRTKANIREDIHDYYGSPDVLRNLINSASAQYHELLQGSSFVDPTPGMRKFTDPAVLFPLNPIETENPESEGTEETEKQTWKTAEGRIERIPLERPPEPDDDGFTPCE